MRVTINGVAVDAGKWPSPEVAAMRELLRQRALALGLLSAEDADEEVIDIAIECLLGKEVRVPAPTEPECRRYYETHPEQFSSGDLVCARHILFQVTPSAPVLKIRSRAEQTLREVLREPERFAALARELSNCPSGQHGGNLGQIARGDTVPEFEQSLFRLGPAGILREIVRTRHGFHVVPIDRRIPGKMLPFEMVHRRIAEQLEALVEGRAPCQYISILAGEAEIHGADLKSAPTPLVQ